MPSGGLDELTSAQKRALLADRLRKRSRLAASGTSGGSASDDAAARASANAGRRSFLDDEVIALASVKDWRAEEQDPYIRYVAPYKGFLYQRLGLDKTFVRGEGCYLFDADGSRLRRLHRAVRRRSVRPRSGSDMAGAGERPAGGAAEPGDYIDFRGARRAGGAIARGGAARARSRRVHEQRRGVGRGGNQAGPLPHRPDRDPVGAQRLPRPHARGHVGDRYANSSSAVSALRCPGSAGAVR